MRVLEELLPIGILVAITIAGKILESRKQKRLQEQSRENSPRVPDAYDEDESYEEESTMPEPVKESPMAPPVVAIPEGLRTILRNFGVEVPTPPPPPLPKVEHFVPPPVKKVRKEVPVQAPEVIKPVLDLSPQAVRAGILWKTVLEEPRAHRPWRPH